MNDDAGTELQNRGLKILCTSREGGEHYVYYKPQVVIAGMPQFLANSPTRRRIVYLTCDLNHTLPYEVESKGEGE